MFVQANNHYHIAKAKPNIQEDICPPFSVILPYSQVIHDVPPPPPINWQKCLSDMDGFIEHLETIEIYNELDAILDIRNNALSLSDVEIEAGFQLALVYLKKDEYSEMCRRTRMYTTVMNYCNAERTRQNDV